MIVEKFEHHGLDCFVCESPSQFVESFNGYVEIRPGHPLFGVNHVDGLDNFTEDAGEMPPEELLTGAPLGFLGRLIAGKPTLSSVLRAPGGITYSGPGFLFEFVMRKKPRNRKMKRFAKSLGFKYCGDRIERLWTSPRDGDIGRLRRYIETVKHQKRWWLGFDTGHAWDLDTDGLFQKFDMEAFLLDPIGNRSALKRKSNKTRKFVSDAVRGLAEQLALLGEAEHSVGEHSVGEHSVKAT